MSTLRHRLHSAGSATYQTLLGGGGGGLIARFAALGTLRALWHPSYGITLNGSGVAAWRDLVAGYVLAQATPGAQPACNATGWNGSPCLEFAGAQYMACAHADWDTFFGGDDTDVVLAAAIDADASTAVLYPVALNTGGTSWIAYVTDATNRDTYIRTATFINAADGATGKRHVAVQSVGTAATIFRNGADVKAATLNAGSLTLTEATIGTRTGAGGVPSNTYFIGTMGIVAFYSTVSDHAALSALMTACGYGPD